MKSTLRLLVLMLCIGIFTVSCLTATTIAEKPKAELSIRDFDVGINLESVVINNLLEVVSADYLFVVEAPNIGYTIENGKSISNDLYFSQIIKANVPNEINHYNFYERINYDNIYKLARDLVT